MANKLGFFLAGSVVGAAAALLCAPRTGVEMRAMMAEKVNEAMGQAQSCASQAQERGAQACTTFASNAQVYVDQARDAAQDACAAAQERVAHSVKIPGVQHSESNEELRAKIEEARQRIAAQVAANEEAAKQASEQAQASDPTVAAPTQASDEAENASVQEAQPAKDTQGE